MSNIPPTAKAYCFPTEKADYKGAASLTLITDVRVVLPSHGEVLVRMRAASINHRDLSMANAQFPGVYPPNLIPLSDGAGDVVAVGEGVTKFAVGDRVINTFFSNWEDGPAKAEHTALGGQVHGVLAQYRTFSETALVFIPSFLSYVEAATIPCTGVTAWNTLFSKSPITPESSVLVLGTGGLSMFVLQICQAVGTRVIVTSSSDAKIARAIEVYGAAGGVNYIKTPDWAPEVRKLTDGKGVDHAMEIGGAGTLLPTVLSAGMGGQVHLLGVALSSGQPDPPTAAIMATAIFGALSLNGVYVGSRKMSEDLVAFITKHHIHPVVDKVFSWTKPEDVVEAFAYQTKGPNMGKVVLTID